MQLSLSLAAEEELLVLRVSGPMSQGWCNSQVIARIPTNNVGVDGVGCLHPFCYINQHKIMRNS